MEKISLMVIDDHSMLREALMTLLSFDSRFKVAAGYGTAEPAFEFLENSSVDVVMLDINLPGISGIDAIEKILHLCPDTKVLVVSAHNFPDYALRMMRKGAKGYVSKFAPREELSKAIIEIKSGNTYICSDIKNSLAEQMIISEEKTGIDSLTYRELEVIDLLKEGYTSKEIANRFGLAVKTIEVHRYNILRKLGLKNTTALINFVHKHLVS